MSEEKKMAQRNVLSPEEMRLEIAVGDDGKLMLCVGATECNGWLQWTKLDFSEFSRTLTCVGDLVEMIRAKGVNDE